MELQLEMPSAFDKPLICTNNHNKFNFNKHKPFYEERHGTDWSIEDSCNTKRNWIGELKKVTIPLTLTFQERQKKFEKKNRLFLSKESQFYIEK